MGVVKKPTLAKMRLLHAVLVEFGPMCVSDAADTADLHKGSSQDWMVRLARLGCVYELPKESPVCVKKNARYYAATDVPFPEDEAVGVHTRETQHAGGTHFEYSRRMVKAVQLGLRRDDMLTAFYGAPKP